MKRTDITNIWMTPGSWGKIKALASITFSNGLTVDGFKVIDGVKGLFVGMPSVPRKNKETGEIEYKNCCYLKEEEDRELFKQILLDKYNAEVGSDLGSENESFFNDDEAGF